MPDKEGRTDNFVVLYWDADDYMWHFDSIHEEVSWAFARKKELEQLSNLQAVVWQRIDEEPLEGKDG